MHITKLGHSCLLIEEGRARIMIDPGVWSEGHTKIEGLDAIFITHKHPDHVDPESLKKILTKNPGVPVYSNDHVIEELRPHKITVERFVDGNRHNIQGLLVEAYGKDHAVIYHTYPRTDNTSYLIGGRLYHPGDSLFVPDVVVDVLALPLVAPWMRMSEAIDFAKMIKPRLAFGIHDGMLKYVDWLQKHPKNLLEPEGIEWKILETGQTYEL